jgi:hypothetical protein
MPKIDSRYLPLFCLLAVCLLLGLATFRDFGAGWDEPSSYQHGREALSAYAHPATEPVYSDSDGLLQYYGAAYLLTGAALGLSTYPAFHLLNFFTFLLGLAAFYALLLRWVSPAAALGGTLLLATQPLLWGHAFINPKDVPFTAFFLVSLAAGFWMLDKMGTASGWERILLPVGCGLLLGYATSTRIAAPLAGGILSLLALFRWRLKALPFLGLYWLACGLAAYATWPYLWPDPFHRFLTSLQTMSAFPWKSKVLFDGIYYHADNLPWRYFPKLLVFQLTEPALLLALAGTLVLLWQLRTRRELVFTLLLWFAAPAAYLVLARPTMYDNFRQFLFITPPIFICCALGLDVLFKRWSRPQFQVVFLLLAALPGLAAGIRLHPYEYVYYNSLAGEISGRYETDYWGTSFREAANYLNEHAPQRAVVSIGPWGQIQELLRPDLVIDRAEISPNSDYVLIFSRWDYEKNPAFTGQPVYTVARAGAVFLTLQRMP